MALTLEQQIAAIMDGGAIDTLQITSVRNDGGELRFYAVAHAGGICAFSPTPNVTNVREAIDGAGTALSQKRRTMGLVGDLALMADAA